ncbi:MAG: NAD(P)H-hydrate dehydratase [Archangium sp.]|nr:NAD(P)H-hydrate dehydratase [Archangium sp.]
MNRLVTASEMRAVETESERLGTSTSTLMQNAGAALARVAVSASRPGGRFVVFCGPGNNGGDGFVAARVLRAGGHSVQVELTTPREALKGEPARQAALASGAGVSMGPGTFEARAGDVVIDAIFGTGLSRAPEGAQAAAIARIAALRAAGAVVVAADVPSGVSADDGRCFTPCVSADVTAAFGVLKRAHATHPAVERCGRIDLQDIGLPTSAMAVLLPPETWLVDEADALARIPPRAADAHKGSAGHVLLIAGSLGKTGAAALAARGALRGGAGLVTIATSGDALAAAMAHSPEVMGHALRSAGALARGDIDAIRAAAQGKDALVIGPGMERGPDAVHVLGELLASLELPCVLDADALNVVAASPDMLRRAKGPLVLTPHPGEMARLTRSTAAAVNADRLAVARAFADEHSVTLVLKGARTVIASPSGACFVNPTGNAGLATGGTGDVLAGLCGALLAQGLAPDDAALVAAYAHGLAGDLAALLYGQRGLVASDVAEQLGAVWRRWNR